MKKGDSKDLEIFGNNNKTAKQIILSHLKKRKICFKNKIGKTVGNPKIQLGKVSKPTALKMMRKKFNKENHIKKASLANWKPAQFHTNKNMGLIKVLYFYV
jgi:hypothetical protein